MKSMIEEIWYGNVFPAEKPMPPGSPLFRATNKVVEAEQALEDELPEEKRELLISLENAQFELSNMLETNAFIDGFRLGAKLVMDIFSEIYD